MSKLEFWHHLSWYIPCKIYNFWIFCKKRFFASDISWQMMSKLEFWHHLSWYIPCKFKIFCFFLSFPSSLILAAPLWARLGISEPPRAAQSRSDLVWASCFPEIPADSRIPKIPADSRRLAFPDSPAKRRAKEKLRENKKILNLQGIYHDKWCQTSSFDIICHHM